MGVWIDMVALLFVKALENGLLVIYYSVRLNSSLVPKSSLIGEDSVFLSLSSHIFERSKANLDIDLEWRFDLRKLV